MRKLCTILCVLFLGFTSVSARDLFDFGVGTVSQFQENPLSQDTMYADWVDISNYLTGSEARLRLLGVDLDANLFHTQGNIVGVTEYGQPIYEDDISHRIFGVATIGISSDVASLTQLGLGLGTRYGLNIGKGRSLSFWAGDKDNIYTQATYKDFFANITLDYRAKLDLRIGGFILSLHYQVPSRGFSYADPSLANLEPDWEQGKIGTAIIGRMF